MNDLENRFSSAAQNATGDDEIAALEAELKNETNITRAEVNQKFDAIEQQITSHRPNPNSSTYTREKEDYAKLLKHSTTGIVTLRQWIGGIFGKLSQIINSIVNWIRNRAMAIVMNIRDAFAALFNSSF